MCYCARLIRELGRCNPMAVNRQRDTPFHVAARCPNSDAMAAMLDTFPTCCFVSENTDDKFENLVVSELLVICARGGHAEAVGRLIRCGADIEIGEVLRVIVDESVRNPSKSRLLLAVYDTLVDHAVLCRCAKTGEEMSRPDSAEYGIQKRRTVLDLLTKPSVGDCTSIMEHIINVGAGKFLRAIFNTPGVFKFDKATEGEAGEVPVGQRRIVSYDVTNMTPYTRSVDGDEDDEYQR